MKLGQRPTLEVGEMTGVKALISGAGPAVLALTHWPARYGAQVRVVEPAAARRTGGQLIDIRGCGRDVVAQTGLAEAGGQARVERGVVAGLRTHEERPRSWIAHIQRFRQGNGGSAAARPAAAGDQIRLPNGFTLPDRTPYERTRP
jgi:hypothetical protein